MNQIVTLNADQMKRIEQLLTPGFELANLMLQDYHRQRVARETEAHTYDTEQQAAADKAAQEAAEQADREAKDAAERDEIAAREKAAAESKANEEAAAAAKKAAETAKV